MTPCTESAPARITEVTVLDGFRVRLTFRDGVTKEMDLDRLVRGPVFQPLRNDRRVFAAAFVDGGTIAWPNGADLDPDVLRYDLEPAGPPRPRRRPARRRSQGAKPARTTAQKPETAPRKPGRAR